jgi:hypothetical protein
MSARDALFGAVISYRGATPKLALRKRNEVYKAGYVWTLTHWHREMRPKHFTHAGATEYRYAPRRGERGGGRRFEGSYTQRKLKKYGHTRPLEFTGESKRASADLKIKATSKGGRCILSTPRLNYRHPDSQVRAREEMTRVSDREVAVLARVFEDYVAAEFARLTDKTTVTV